MDSRALVKVGAVAGLTFRSVVHSRLLVSLAVLLFCIVLALPWLIKDDGTLSGRMEVLLQYTLVSVSFLLTLGSLWAGAALMAGELADRRLQLVLVKPVHPFYVWCGKWIGILGMQASLLLLAGSLCYLQLRSNMSASRAASADSGAFAERVLVARRIVSPQPEAVDGPVRARLAEARARGAIPNDLTDAKAYEMVEHQVRAESCVVHPGQRRGWAFKPGAMPSQGAVLLRFRFSSSAQMDKPTVRGEWCVQADGQREPFRVTEESRAGVVQELTIPRDTFHGAQLVRVEYRNAETEVPAAVLFAAEDGPVLRIVAGGMAANLLRALLVLLCQQALFAAIGLTMGGLFSTPVAVFASLFCMVLASMSDYVSWVVRTGVLYVTHEGEIPPATAWDAAVKMLFRLLNVVVGPLHDLDPLRSLADGDVVGWPMVARAALVLAGGFAGVLALVCAFVLRRRELATS